MYVIFKCQLKLLILCLLIIEYKGDKSEVFIKKVFIRAYKNFIIKLDVWECYNLFIYATIINCMPLYVRHCRP